MPVKDCVQLGFCVWYAVKLKWAKSEMLRFFFVFIFIFRIFFFSFNCSLYYFLLFRSSFFPVRFFLCGQRCARPATVYDNIGSTNKRIFGSNFIRISSLSNAYIESTKWAKWAHTNTTQHNAPLPFHFHIRWCVCVLSPQSEWATQKKILHVFQLFIKLQIKRWRRRDNVVIGKYTKKRETDGDRERKIHRENENKNQIYTKQLELTNLPG